MKLRTFLERHAEGMKRCFHLEHFDISLRYDKDLACQMEIDIDYRYLEAEICYGRQIKESWHDENRHAVLKCLAHELTHLITSNLSQPFKMKRRVTGEELVHFDEQVTEHVSRLLYLLYIKETEI